MAPAAATDLDRTDRLRPIWAAVDALLENASFDGILAHKLGPLEALRRRRLGLPLPEELLVEERVAALMAATAVPLLRRVRECTDEPLLLFKGPEIAALYPGGTRHFKDLDLLTPDPEAVQQSLLDAGFVVESQSLRDDHHHLQPLRWPAFPLTVEIHGHASAALQPRMTSQREIFEVAIPSSLGVEGVLAPGPIHHAVIIAAHGWGHRPFRVLRDLIDVAAASAQADERELERLAAAWGVEPVWRLTRAAVDWLFYGGPRTTPLRLWARHLEQVRELRVFEADVESLISGFWWLPPRQALARSLGVIRERTARAPGRTRRDKLGAAARWARAGAQPLSRRPPGRAENDREAVRDA